jgi:Tol biopolymer transport system component
MKKRNVRALSGLLIAWAGCQIQPSIGISLPTGPFVDPQLYDGARSGAVNTLSADGRYAVYDVDDSYVSSDGTNVALRDVVVYDKVLDRVTRITFGDSDSYGGTISGDGRYLAFVSAATDLTARNKAIPVPDIGFITNSGPHVFVADLRTDLGHVSVPTAYTMVDTSYLDEVADCRAKSPVTMACSGGDGPAVQAVISQDGSTVAYVSYALNIDPDLHEADSLSRIYLWDRATKSSRDITPWFNGNSNSPTLNFDGSLLAFVSTASDIISATVPAPDVQGGNIFVWSRTSGKFDLVSRNGDLPANAPSWSPNISSDGKWIAYTTRASNLDANDTNQRPDVYSFNVPTGKSYAVSGMRLLGDCHDGMVQIGSWKPMCLSNAFSEEGASESSISSDGRYIAFMSASPLINQVGDTDSCDAVDTNNRLDVYVADMANGGELMLQTMLRDSTGKLWPTPAGESRFPSISADATTISFETSNSAFYIKDFQRIADPPYTGDGAPKVFLVNGIQRRPCS